MERKREEDRTRETPHRNFLSSASVCALFLSLSLSLFANDNEYTRGRGFEKRRIKTISRLVSF